MRIIDSARGNLAIGLFSACIVALCATTTVLALEVKALRPQARELQRRKNFPFVGQYLPTVRAATLSGDTVTVGETVQGRSQVLIYFATNCQYCRETLPQWKRISDSLLADPQKRFDVVWISMSGVDSTRDYAASHAIHGTIVRMPNPKINRVARVKGVPMTLVVDRNGQIAHVHPSVFQTAMAADSVIAAARRAATLAAVARPSRQSTASVAEPRGD